MYDAFKNNFTGILAWKLSFTDETLLCDINFLNMASVLIKKTFGS